jgi:hypothetical protein
MANTLITSSMIAKEALMQLENNCVMGNLVHRDYKKEFVKVGDSVSVRRPVRFSATDGATLSKQDVTEGKTSITIDQRKHVGWEFNSNDLTLKIEKYSERYIKPAMITLAQSVDSALTGLYKGVYNFVGTPGTTPSTFASLGAAGQRLDEGAVPPESRCSVLNPAAAWAIANDLKSLATNDSKAKGAFEEAKIGRYARTDTYMDQSIKVHTVGAHGGTPLINGADQNVTYATSKDTNAQDVITDGWTASAAVLKQGDVITFAGVYAVNPVTKESTGELQHFVVNEDVTADGTGNATFEISPPIITSGAYQTVSAVPADNAAITVKTGTASTGYAQNLVFHKNALALVTCPLIIPDGAAFSARESHDGYSVRVVKDYDITNDTDIIRLDILYGVKTIYADLACRLTG